MVIVSVLLNILFGYKWKKALNHRSREMGEVTEMLTLERELKDAIQREKIVRAKIDIVMERQRNRVLFV